MDASISSEATTRTHQQDAAELSGVIPAEVDYVVLGAGTAGCVVAARLSEDAQVSVVLLEAGGTLDPAVVAVPGRWQELGTVPRCMRT